MTNFFARDVNFRFVLSLISLLIGTRVTLHSVDDIFNCTSLSDFCFEYRFLIFLSDCETSTLRKSVFRYSVTRRLHYNTFQQSWKVFMHFVCLSVYPHFKAVLKSKLATFWPVFEGIFYRQHIKFVGILIFKIENRLTFFVFQ